MEYIKLYEDSYPRTRIDLGNLTIFPSYNLGIVVRDWWENILKARGFLKTG